MDTIDKLYQKGVSRRNFLVAAGAAGAVAALAGCNDSGTTTTTTGPINSLQDSDILTFALNLEYLEAEYYLYAASGAGLSAADAGTNAGTTILTAGVNTKVASNASLTAAQQAYINEVAYDEQTHVKYLRSALGSAAVSRPAIDLTFFGPLAVAAGITTAPTGTGSFSPFTSFDNWVIGGFIFEDVGVTAYNGAAPLISAAGVASGYLTAAAGILAVEAYHASFFRTYLTGQAIAQQTSSTATAYAPFGYAQKVQGLRSQLGGGGETLLALPNQTTGIGTTIVNANTSALAYARTPDQVHHIVYGNVTPGTGSGGFFPNGTNYRFSKTTT